MTFAFKLERLDGTPGRAAVDQERRAERRVGDTIPIRRDRTLRVVGIVVSNDDEPPVLVVEDVA
jgi:hypothetical protein